MVEHDWEWWVEEKGGEGKEREGGVGLKAVLQMAPLQQRCRTCSNGSSSRHTNAIEALAEKFANLLGILMGSKYFVSNDEYYDVIAVVQDTSVIQNIPSE